MDDFSGAPAIAKRGEITLLHDSPLCRAKAISGLISEEALASERLDRLTDKVAAALMDAKLCSIRLPKADGGLGGTGVDLFEAAEEIAHADGSAGWCMGISGWCEEVDAVVPPAEPAREFRHGHDFEAGDAELGESRQLTRSGFPAAIRGEGADMQLVDDELLASAPAPRTVGPSKLPRIDDFGGSMRSLRLKSRRRVGQCLFTPIEAETIAHAGSGRHAPQ
jgi:hypothetical protein